MEESFELYLHIYKTSEMGKYTTTRLIEELKSKDNKIKKVVEDILKKYESFMGEAESYLTANDVKLEENSMMSKMGASMGIKKEVMNDNSDSSISEVLIQGLSMGSLEMERKISDYEKKVDKKQIKFAKEFLHFQQASISELKKYL